MPPPRLRKGVIYFLIRVNVMQFSGRMRIETFFTDCQSVPIEKLFY